MLKTVQTYTPQQQQRIAELRAMNAAQWESICKGCGVCCLRKADIGFNTTLYMDLCCPHLDCKTHRCSIYNDRLIRRANRCHKVDIDIVLDGTLLPASCGYREYIFGPAKFPAQVDWSRVKPITDAKWLKFSFNNVSKHAIIDSMAWNIR